jgi:hypothetical protein
MHVDEVQLEGGGTEAVITGNMENPGKRLTVLEGDEVEALYGRPCFTHEECVQYFALSPKEKAALDQLHSLKSRDSTKSPCSSAIPWTSAIGEIKSEIGRGDRMRPL